MNLCNPSVVKELMARAGIRFRKEYGQNFLIDPTVPEQIAEHCTEDPADVILEIGPGIGCLTQELAERYSRVIAVEIDRGLMPVLEETLSGYSNVTVVNADIMKVSLSDLFAGEEIDPLTSSVSVCANLPYYITTPILMRLLESGIPFSNITVMVQKEVADRLTAAPGSSEYGAITAVLGYYGEIERLFSVSRSCFLPHPNVDSAVVRIRLYRTPIYALQDALFFFQVIHGAFEMRRKTLVNALSAKCPEFTKEEIAKVLVEMGLSDAIRGERLSTAQFAELSNRLSGLSKNKNG